MTLQRPMFPPRAEEIDPTQFDYVDINGPGPASLSIGEPLYVPTDVSPEDVFRALGRLRAEAEAAIERLLALIDDLDGDPESEEAGDEAEPDLGSVDGRQEFDQSTWAAGLDAEPSLAAKECHPTPDTYWSRSRPVRRHPDGSQLNWTEGNSDEREGDPGFDDREGDELQHGGESERENDELAGDDEPSLGAFDRVTNQEHAWRQAFGDLSGWPHFTNNDCEAAPGGEHGSITSDTE